MMNIFLVRHGEAETYANSDAERKLTPHGIEQAIETAQWLKLQLVESTTIQLLCSRYVRAQKTAEIIGAELGVFPIVIDGITPESNPRIALTALEKTFTTQPPSSVIMVSHMPLVAELTQWLTEGHVSVGRGFSPAEVRWLQATVLGPSTAHLKGFFVPGID
jgi:phosphohistidine phosphatase